MKAIIMAGGAGSRLRPLTCGRPKPIVPIMNKPVMAHIIELLKKNGITDIGVTLQYLPEKIEDIFGDGSEYGVNMQYFVEDSPLGTAGSVKNAEEFLDDTFVVISGDALTDIDLTKAIKFHKSKKTICTLVLKEVAVPLEYGIVVTDENGKITRFLEKPSWGEVFSNLANTGIYILEPKALSYFEKNKKFDFSQDLFPLLMNEGNDLYGYTTTEYWCDVGDIGSYIQSHIDILDNKVKVTLNEAESTKGIYIGKNVDIDKTATIKAPAVIGDNCKIGKNVQIEEYTVLGENTVVDDGSIVKRSIVWPNTHIGSNARISAGILCYGNNLKSNVTVLEEAVVGDECQIKDRAVIKSGVKIWPNKIIQTATSVNESIIWGTKVSRTLFGKTGITGEMNVEITPEYVSKLGLAYASILKPGCKFAVSSDASTAAGLLKTAVLAGVASSGVETFDLGHTMLPVVRNVINFFSIDAGIHIALEPQHEDRIKISFLDSKGINIARGIERKIENIFVTGEFRRVNVEKIKGTSVLENYNYFYIQNLINTLNVEAIRRKNVKVVVGKCNNFIYEMLETVLRDLNCTVIGARRESSEETLSVLSQKVVDLGADFGVNIANDAESMTLIDNKGRVISGDLYTALISIISVKLKVSDKIVVPVTSSSAFEEIATKYNATIVRTKTAQQEHMSKLMASSTAEAKKNFILNYDAIAATAKIVDYIASENTTISSLIETIPEFHLIKKDIECPWNAKGKVMRELANSGNSTNVELFEGVKIHHDKGWVLVLPDADEPVCTIYTEGVTADAAEALSNMYVEKINNIIH
ncbi:MAG: NTP transferase domain-containing protein [Clostridia bacterium]|nr:NTP transferase domain-containing protein [Clostridia bacterium]